MYHLVQYFLELSSLRRIASLFLFFFSLLLVTEKKARPYRFCTPYQAYSEAKSGLLCLDLLLPPDEDGTLAPCRRRTRTQLLSDFWVTSIETVAVG